MRRGRHRDSKLKITMIYVFPEMKTAMGNWGRGLLFCDEKVPILRNEASTHAHICTHLSVPSTDSLIGVERLPPMSTLEWL